MANEDKLDVQLNLITSGATKALDGLKSSFTNTFKGLNLDLGKTASGLTGMTKSLFSVKNAAIAAGTSLVTYFASKEILNKAIAQEEAINSVAIALGRTGEYSRAALADLENFAKALQLQTAYGDEEILKQISLAQAFGATASQAKVITKASIELAAATGKSLDEATRQVSKTLGGFAGELGEVNPRIKALTESQLKNGEAANILLQQYGGTAIGKIKTFNGALEQNKNVFDGVLENIGMLITKNPVVVEGIRALTQIFANLAAYLEKNRDAIISFINNGLIKLLNFAPTVGTVFKGMVTALTIITKAFVLAGAGARTIIDAFIQFGPVKLLLDGVLKAIFTITGGIADLLSLLVKLPGVADTFEALGINAEDLSVSLGKAANEAYELIGSFNTDSISKGIEKANDFAFAIVEGADEVKNNLNKAIDAGVEKATQLAKTVGSISKQGTIELKVTNNVESSKKSIDNYQQLLETAFGPGNGAKIGGTLVSGIVSGLKNGKEGARAMLSSLAGAAADAFLPGLGAAVGPLVDALSMGPDAVRQMVKDFAGALPDLIENIILAIPVIIEEFSNQIPIIIERLAERAPEIIQSLVRSAPKVITALALQMPKIGLALAKEAPNIAIGLITGLIKEAPKFIEALIRGIGDAIKKFLGLGGKGGIGGILGKAGKGIGGFVKSVVGGVGGAVKSVGKFLGFARGGEVPEGYPNDNFPAKLSSRELVIDRSTTKGLKDFLKNGGNAGVSEVLLARLVSLMEQPQVVRSSVQVNNREFANIILQLNRTQQRTS